MFALYTLFQRCAMGRKFRLGRRCKCAECSKGGALSLVVSLPRQALVIHVSSGLSVVSPIKDNAPTACPSTSRTNDFNSSEFLKAIYSFPSPSAFTCGTLLKSERLGARLLKITLPSPWVIQWRIQGGGRWCPDPPLRPDDE